MVKKILIVSREPADISSAFHRGEALDIRRRFELTSEEADPGYDWIVLYRCHEIIREPWLTAYKDRIINIHISLLPWNRGADPNFWSWYDDTPKGVSIHLVNKGIDTGPIIAQKEVKFSNVSEHTLKTTYFELCSRASNFFCNVWPLIDSGFLRPVTQRHGGSYHKTKDRFPIMLKHKIDYETPVQIVQKLGEQARRLSK